MFYLNWIFNLTFDREVSIFNIIQLVLVRVLDRFNGPMLITFVFGIFRFDFRHVQLVF